jgi:hypothetical protein
VHGINRRADRTWVLQPQEMATILLDLATGAGNEGG